MAAIRRRLGRLTQQQLKFLHAYAASGDGISAALSAGYSRSSAPQMVRRTLRNPLALDYLETLRAKSRAITAYDLSTAMRESLAVIEFAKERGNAMAYFKAVEHRAKLMGLLVERVETVSVDLTAALAEAKRRWIERSAKASPAAELAAEPSALEGSRKEEEQRGVSVKSEQGGGGAGGGARLCGSI